MPTPQTPRHAAKGNRKIVLDLPRQGAVPIYSNQRVLDALDEVMGDITTYRGVKLISVMEAVYQQGVKNGKEEVLDAQAAAMREVEKNLRPKKIGRPRVR